MTRVVVRQAHAGDAPELVRLRGVMLAAIHGGDPHAPGAWRAIATDTLHKRLSDPDPTLAAFVVDRAGAGLAACAVGVVETRLGGPDNPSGEVGYIFNVVTDEDQRRQGFSRACMQALLAWFAERGIVRIELAASVEGEPLYRQMGFKPTTSPRMQLKLHDSSATMMVPQIVSNVLPMA